MDCPTVEASGVKTVLLDSDRDLQNALDRLGLKNGPVLVLVGGAGSMHPLTEPPGLHKLFFEVLAPLAESLHAIVIDGGTDVGIMRLMGAARSGIRGTFPLLGIAAIGTVDLPDRSGQGPETAALEPRHSHFLIVPGSRFGEESPWIAKAASRLAEGHRSLTLVINGGAITLRDISFSVREKRPVLVISGSGRTADRVADALAGRDLDPEIRSLVSSGLIEALEIDRDAAEITQAMGRRLID